MHSSRTPNPITRVTCLGHCDIAMVHILTFWTNDNSFYSTRGGTTRSTIQRTLASTMPALFRAGPRLLAAPAAGGGTASAAGGLLPNRFTAAFAEMKRTCPDEIRGYADCVLRGQGEGELRRGSCDAEFALVRGCFRRARRRAASDASRR